MNSTLDSRLAEAYLAVRSQENTTVSPPEWEQPIPLDRGDRPPFPVTTFPDWLRRFVEAEAESTQTPRDMAGALALGAVATTLQGKVAVTPKAGYEEPVNVFIATVMGPGERKSTVFQHIVSPLLTFEEEERERRSTEVAVAQQRRRVLAKRMERAESEAAKATGVEAEEWEREAAQLQEELRQMPEPVHARLWTDDATAEALSMLLVRHGGRMSVFSPEGGGVAAIMAGRYSKGPNFEVYLKGHAGDAIRVDRRNAEPLFVQRPALTLCLALQPAVLQGVLRTPEFRGRGLLGRFLYTIPESLQGARCIDAPSMPAQIRHGYEQGLRALLEITSCVGENGGLQPRYLTLDRVSHGAWLEFQQWLEPQLARGGNLESLRDWAGKAGGASLRIAGLLHCAEVLAPDPWNSPISHATMNRAVELTRYFIEHARAFWQTRAACWTADVQPRGGRRGGVCSLRRA